VKDLQTQTLGVLKESAIGETCAHKTLLATRNDDDHACREFLETHSALMKRVVRAELRQKGCIAPEGHHDEVLAEVCLKVLRNWSSLHSPKDAIHSITKFEARAHARKCRRESPQEIDERDIPLFMSVAVDPTAMYEAAICLKELLSQLDEVDQRIFSLRFQEWSFEQIAEQIGIPSVRARSRYYRAIERLRRANSSLVSNVTPSYERPATRLGNSMFER
jgi:RNA polymerase sigma factor (sigma-70 family)